MERKNFKLKTAAELDEFEQLHAARIAAKRKEIEQLEAEAQETEEEAEAGSSIPTFSCQPRSGRKDEEEGGGAGEGGWGVGASLVA